MSTSTNQMKEELKALVIKTIDEHKNEIATLAEIIDKNPEYGFKEFFATKTMSEKLSSLGLSVEENIAVTGCRATAKGRKNDIRIAVMGEMDAVPCALYPKANQETMASHSCGHNIQLANMYAIAIGLVKSGVIKQLDGEVDFMAVPAEEFIELEFRANLKKEGKIKYFGGKQELISRGAFDNIDMAMMMHSFDLGNKKLRVGATTNGFLGKQAKFIGKASHAGGAPHLGVNSLNSITIALQAANALRETFVDEDHVRFHPIVTKGGSGVNSVPDETRLEAYIRASKIETIQETNRKINRALVAGALFNEASVEITDTAGYFPYLENPTLSKLFVENAKDLIDKDHIIEGGHYAFSLDIGDLSHLMPTLHPFVGGIFSDLHSKDFNITDSDTALLLSAKAQACTIIDLLFDGAIKAKELKKSYKPTMSKVDYLALMDSLNRQTTIKPSDIIDKLL